MYGRFNKYEAKQNIITSAHKVNNAIKTHMTISYEYSILSRYADLTKEMLNKFITTKDINERVISNELLKLKEKVIQTNRNLKTEKRTLEGKVANISNRMLTEVFKLSGQLEKKEEDSFLLENELFLKSAIINKIKKDKKSLNIIQEFERDIYITDPEKIDNFFSMENILCQEQLIKISKRLNIERQRINTLKSQLGESYKEKALSIILNTHSNLYSNSMSGNFREQTPLVTLVNEEKDLIDNENEELIFEDFSNSSDESKTEEENIAFPSKVAALPLPLAMNSNKPIEKIPILKLVPTLDLKQIEFNKIKISQDTDPITDEDVTPTAKENINHKIERIKNEIKLLKKTTQNNKAIISNFKPFYAKMNLRYSNLQKKYIEMKQQADKLEQNASGKSDEKAYHPMVSSIKIRKVSK